MINHLALAKRLVKRFGFNTMTIVCLSYVGASCTGADIQRIIPEEIKPVFDDKLAVKGQFCTSDPDDLEFPVKILFVVDASDSMVVNDYFDATEPDPTKKTGRTKAIRDVVDQFIDINLQPTTSCIVGSTTSACAASEKCIGPQNGQGTCVALCDTNATGCASGVAGCSQCAGDACLNGICGTFLDQGVKFGIVRFAGAKEALTKDSDGNPGFTNNPQDLVSSIPLLNQAAGVTDYEGAIAEAAKFLREDMLKARDEDRAALARTKYVVVFLSDGLPYPQVNDGDDWDDIADSVFQQITANDPNASKDIYRNVVRQYNISSKILKRVEELVSLRVEFGAGDIKFHTAFLSGQNDSFVQQQATFLLDTMAKVGSGTFRNFQNGEDINFLGAVDFSSLRRVFKLKSFIVSNFNARLVGSDFITDSDGDGLSDPRETLAGTDRARLDTDGDGFSDTLEYFFRSSGGDALDPNDSDCALAGNDADGDEKIDDRDGDGLYDCEERFLGTNRNAMDTDGDGIPDNVEIIYGTNPVLYDLETDLDFDGMPNGDEIRLHTDPRVDDAAHRSRTSYRYNEQRTGTGIETVAISCIGDGDCPSGGNCREGYCRCATTDECNTNATCTQNDECSRIGEKCVNGKCQGTWACGPLEQFGTENVCGATKHISCYEYSVENVTLVSPRGATAATDNWNTIYLYFSEAPFDNPRAQGNFLMGCVRARYDDTTGAKLPATGDIDFPITAWKLPSEFDPNLHCLCPDGTTGTCQ